jgi:hypothetical protein
MQQGTRSVSALGNRLWPSMLASQKHSAHGFVIWCLLFRTEVQRCAKCFKSRHSPNTHASWPFSLCVYKILRAGLILPRHHNLSTMVQSDATSARIAAVLWPFFVLEAYCTCMSCLLSQYNSGVGMHR